MNLSRNSQNGLLKYNVSSEQTLESLSAVFGNEITVYNPQGSVVTDKSELLGTGSRVAYKRNGITIYQTIIVEN